MHSRFKYFINKDSSIFKVKRFLHGLNIGSVLMLVYVIVLMRQYGWYFNHLNWLWTGCGIIGFVIWSGLEYIRQNYMREIIIEWRRFILIVAIPLFLFYLLHGVFMDFGDDWMQIRYVFGIHGLSGKFVDGTDLYYSFSYGNILSDMIYCSFVKWFGLRLANVLPFLLSIWIAIEVFKILSFLGISDNFCCVATLFSVIINTIMSFGNATVLDIMGIPLIIQCIYFCINRNIKFDYKLICYISFCLGLCVAIKFTNTIYVIPLMIWLFYRIIRLDTKQHILMFASMIAGVLPLIPYGVWGILTYNDPFYCLLSIKFDLGYWPYIENAGLNKVDARWGGRTLMESIFWPMLSMFHYNRLSELQMPSVRLFLGSITSLCILCCAKRIGNNPIKILSLFCATVGMFWGIQSGYVRYAVGLEVLYGILLSFAIYHFMEKQFKYWSRLGMLLCFLCVAQVLFDLFVFFRGNIWAGRPFIFDNPSLSIENARLLGRDRNWLEMQSEDVQDSLVDVDYWFVSSTDFFVAMGWAILLRDAPLIGINPGLINMPVIRSNVLNYLKNKKDQNGYMMIPHERDIPKAKKCIDSLNVGMSIAHIIPIKLNIDYQQSLMVYLLHLKIE